MKLFSKSIDDYFKDEASKYIYCLIESGGGLQANLNMGLTKQLYYDEELCDEWYNKLYSCIVNSNHKNKEQALDVLKIKHDGIIRAINADKDNLNEGE